MVVVEPTLPENRLPLSITTRMILFLFSSLVTLLILFIIYLTTNTFTLIKVLSKIAYMHSLVKGNERHKDHCQCCGIDSFTLKLATSICAIAVINWLLHMFLTWFLEIRGRGLPSTLKIATVAGGFLRTIEMLTSPWLACGKNVY
jgi:hypothetical protein